ncbi:MAG: hypothetical protein JXR69_01045 [Candidatus Delongbacteria bacterium]|nr:hypothetical protein [Candidatus Delongbacteria bacterium]
MKKLNKILLDATIVTIICSVLIFFVVFFAGILDSFFGISVAIITLFIIYFTSLALTLWFFGLLYRSVRSINVKYSGIKKIIFVIFFTVVWYGNSKIVKFYLFVNSEIENFYDYVVIGDGKRDIEGLVYKFDRDLGFEPVEDSKGFHIKPMKDKIPVRYNKYGFRIPTKDRSKDEINTDHKSVLFLGCSFTFGDGCLAEETFPYAVCDSMDMNCLNAGVCGYGLSQMLIRAEYLIPEFKPDYVVIQYSPWLVKRSVELYAPSYIGLIPNPFFSCDSNKNVSLVKPLFETNLFSFDKFEIKNKYQNDYLYFYMDFGIPYAIDQWKAENIIEGNTIPVCHDIDRIENYAYGKIIETALDNESIPIILNLGNLNYSKRSVNFFSKFEKVEFADADSLLDYELKFSGTQDFSREYHHWVMKNDTLHLVDKHPNPKAHKIIAASILKILEDLQISN